MDSIEGFKARFGHYPQAVIVDKIYRTRGNTAIAKSKGIRLSGPPLRRPNKDEELLKKHMKEE